MNFKLRILALLLLVMMVFTSCSLDSFVQMSPGFGAGTTTTTTTTKPATTTATKKIVKGTVVSIVKGAKYSNGASVPLWVRNKKWVVKENPVGDRVVIDKSADGKHSICSAISSKYLTIVG